MILFLSTGSTFQIGIRRHPCQIFTMVYPSRSSKLKWPEQQRFVCTTIEFVWKASIKEFCSIPHWRPVTACTPARWSSIRLDVQSDHRAGVKAVTIPFQKKWSLSWILWTYKRFLIQWTRKILRWCDSQVVLGVANVHVDALPLQKDTSRETDIGWMLSTGFHVLLSSVVIAEC